MNVVYVKEKNQYGLKYYPDCQRSKILANFANVDCFSPRMISCLRGLGYRIRVRPKEVTVRPPKICVCESCGHVELKASETPDQSPSL